VGLLDDETRIIGVARHELSQEDFVSKMRESLETFLKEEPMNHQILPGWKLGPVASVALLARDGREWEE